MEQPTHVDIPGAVPAAVDARSGIVDENKEAAAVDDDAQAAPAAAAHATVANNTNDEDDTGDDSDDEEEDDDRIIEPDGDSTTDDDDDDDDDDDHSMDDDSSDDSNDDDDDEDDDDVEDVDDDGEECTALDHLDLDGQERICSEATTLLHTRCNFPSRLRDRTMVRFAQQFITNVDEGTEGIGDNNAVVAIAVAAAAAAADSDDEEDDDDDDDDMEDGTVVDVATLDLLDPDVRDQICSEAITLLLERSNDLSWQRNRTIVRFAHQFIRNVKEDIHKTITDTRTVEEGYDGLDRARDTDEEVATAIRCYPEVLTRKDERFPTRVLPIHCVPFMIGNDTKIVCNVKAVAFVPLFAKLAIEFNSFEENKRGGLLCEDHQGLNVIKCLMNSSDSSFDDQHQQHADTTFLAVLIRLHQAGLFTNDDIQKYELVHFVCIHAGVLFSVHRFRFLTECCPSALLDIDNDVFGYVPLQWALKSELTTFEIVLDTMVRYFPRWKGLTALFQKDRLCGESSFAHACAKYSHSKVIEIVEQIIVRYSITIPPQSFNIGEALMRAAIDDKISLDGVYFLMRRHPITMLSMQRDRHDEKLLTAATVSLLSSNGNSNSNTRGDDLHNNNYDNDTPRNKSTQKRKRG